ncbi:hypothetical protein HWV62_25862 [Athelia sp. TMB]|nr:hypothetical protein HWV62_25862 [Athelia sp. TMB]
MSFLASNSLLRPCQRAYLMANSVVGRQFSSTPVALARQKTQKINIPSKKALAAKARRRAAKAPKGIYDKEKMTLNDAIAVLRAFDVAKPNATYEMVIRTAMSRGTTIPKGRVNMPREAKPKREDKILVFADGKLAQEAREAGAHIVGGEELIEGVISGKYQATTVLCSSALIRTITPRLGRILGPKGLMPSERRGTVTDNIAEYIKKLSSSTEWRGDKAGSIRMPVGKLFFPIDDVVKNVRHFLGSVKRATGNEKDTESDTKKSKGPKAVNAITKVILTTTQGPAIQIRDF